MFRNAVTLFRRADRTLYALWAAACTLASARMFYGYMLKQTGGEWSAPLDDVFIHFDYARSTALGYPFQWTVGNGYSSGNTSLTYPFVLAAGWLSGFTGRELMVWAAIVAMTSVFAVLLAARRLFFTNPRDAFGRAASYLLPPIFLGVGALDWSLWSGMEVAFFLLTWAVALVAWLDLEEALRGPPGADGRRARARAWRLGLAGVLLVTTRPEAALTLAVFGVAAALIVRDAGLKRVTGLLARVGAPGMVALALQAVANRALTGESSANGAIVKLALNNPYMTAREKLADWVGNVGYATMRNIDYHFADAQGEHLSALIADGPGALARLAHHARWAGVVPVAIALLPLFFRRTRRVAVVLWAQVALWILLVALNGQVRWQNERYVMPAVAWLLVLAALGVSVALRRGTRRRHDARPGRLAHPARVALVAAALLFAYDHQIPKMRDQKWFFGRASRNIRDQQLTLGDYLADLEPRRILVGDAGAILYASNRPGLDIIGLGGYHDLPFARAGVHGLPATVELIERIPPSDRPDVLAIFPTWWGVLPLWFGGDVIGRFPVEGNVICGGYEHVVYLADWHLLGTGERLRAMPPGDTRVAMSVDVGDLLSERAGGYRFDRPSNGWTDMRILTDPADETRDMFDAGRRIAVGRGERFVARGLTPGAPAHLVVRTAPEKTTRVRVRVDGRDAGAIELHRTGGWVEANVAIGHVASGATIELVNEGPGDFVDFHAWLTE